MEFASCRRCRLAGCVGLALAIVAARPPVAGAQRPEPAAPRPFVMPAASLPPDEPAHASRTPAPASRLTGTPYSSGERALLAAVGWGVGAVIGARLVREPRCLVGDSPGRCPGDIPAGYLVGGALGIALGAAAGPHRHCGYRARQWRAALASGIGAGLAAINYNRRDAARTYGLLFPIGSTAAAVVAIQRCRAA